MFQKPLPIPPVATPIVSQQINGITVDFYETYIQSFQQQVYPDLGPANLVGYNGTAPGPTYYVQRGHETIIRYYNKGTEDSVIHLHGSASHAAWDGWAMDAVHPGQWKDYYYPNYETARPMWYHDHDDGHTASHAYYGQAGVYIVYDPAEDVLGLPTGKYDVPLTITDKKYQANGDLASPTGDPMNFFGDIIQVNEQPWPYLSVEPRKYRFRLFDMSLSRVYNLYFADASGNQIPFQIIGSDSGLFGSPVSAQAVTIASGERYEVVIDFSAYKGQKIVLGNQMSQAQVQEYANTNKVMQFNVGTTVSDNTNNGNVPGVLNGNIAWPASRDTVDHVFNFQMGGDATWTINGVSFEDVNNRVLARPPQGTVELWELRHTGGPAVHPVHVHLVNLQIVSRTGGRSLQPYETAGLKDIVYLEPGEVVRVRAFYGPWNGVYMFHCHNLIHEDNAMMAVFNTTALAGLGYEYDSTQQYSDPMDTRFAPRDYDAADWSQGAIISAMSSLGALSAYAQATALIAAENLSGYGFPSTSVQAQPSVYTPTPTTSKSNPYSPPGRQSPTGRPGRGSFFNRREEGDLDVLTPLDSIVTPAPSVALAFRA
ncbi:bilirubin oxidase [Polychaeton citri CBS 116435]|uniref:Bilirubin oxidase n=1 Tax=Polychaeton citri CBS 116435 TaxID=1314669 RepID=A0A9P4UQS6_9PEZI|nr:bilirubin oxidase [Polychaeton citri CBS 116435]